MAKKKSTTNRKKNRKGAAGKSNADVAEDHGYEVSAYLQYLQNKPNLTSREERLLPMYEYAETTNMSEVVLFKDDKSLRKAINDLESWEKADLLYSTDPRMWLFTIQDMIAKDEDIFNEVLEDPRLPKFLEQLESRTMEMILSSVFSERIQGVLIEGVVLDMTLVFMMEIMRKKNATSDYCTLAGSYCKLMDYFSKVAKDIEEMSRTGGEETSRLTGYVLCQLMVMSFVHLHKNISSGVASEIVFLSGILVAGLRHITLPWTIVVPTDDDEDMIRDFFISLCCPLACMHKTFKRGSPCHNALVDILQGRVRPCKENEFVMKELYSLKKCIDLKNHRPINAHISNPAIEIFRHTCFKCKKMNDSKEMLVCAKCKFVSYCSKECQIGDWDDHKADCTKFQNEGYKREKKFVRKFFTKHQHLITEKVKAASLEDGHDTMELFIPLDFSFCSENGIAPALRDIPEFDVIPLKNHLLNHGEIQVSRFEHYTEDDVKRFIDKMISKLGKNFVIIFVSFADKDCIGAVHFQSDAYGEIWFL